MAVNIILRSGCNRPLQSPAKGRFHHLACIALLAALFYWPGEGIAHPDLLMRIEQLSAQIASDPSDIDARIQRGELYRRHGDWALGSADLGKARELYPDHPAGGVVQGMLAARIDQYQRFVGDGFAAVACSVYLHEE